MVAFLKTWRGSLSQVSLLITSQWYHGLVTQLDWLKKQNLEEVVQGLGHLW